MRHRLFCFFSFLSLLLCIATTILWARSYYRPDGIVAGHWHYQLHPYQTKYFDAREANALSSHGHLMARVYLRQCVVRPGDGPAIPPPPWTILKIDPPDSDFLYETEDVLFDGGFAKGAMGFRYLNRRNAIAVAAPHAAAVFLLAILPLAYVRVRRRQRSKRRAGLCDVCGYDLRATPGRCPECGAITESVGTKDPTAAI